MAVFILFNLKTNHTYIDSTLLPQPQTERKQKLVTCNILISFTLSITLCLMITGVNLSFGQTTYTWNGSISSAWGNAANWTPSGVPGTMDEVIIVASSNNPVYDGSTAPTAFTINSGTFDINGFNLSINGTVTLSGGTLNNGTFTVNGSTDQTCTIGNITTTANCDLVITSGIVIINGGTFNGTVSITQTGTSTSTGTGGATFNNTTAITVNSSGSLHINGGNTYNGNVIYTTNNSATLIPEFTTSSIYNGTLTLNNSGTGKISLAYSGATNQLNDNLYIKIAGGGSVIFGENNGTCGLASSKTINAWDSGITSGMLKLNNFIQLGNTAQSLSGSDDAALYLEKGTEFNGNVSFTFPKIYLNGATFNKAATITFTGNSGNQSEGGNTYNDDFEFIKSGNGNYIHSNDKRDVYNGNATFTNTAGGILYIAHNDETNATLFNGNLYINNTGSGSVRIGQGTGSAILADGKVISVGSLGVSSGAIQLKNLTQNGSTPQSLTFTGSAIMRIQNNCVFNGNVTFISPQIFVNGTTFNGTAYLEKSGSNSNTSLGGNIFNQDATIKNSGSGAMTLANSNADQFYGNATFIKTGTGALNPAANTACTFSKNISTSGSNASITFGNDAGSVILNGTIPQYIQGDNIYPPTIKRLTLNNGTGGSVTLQVPVDVSDQLTLTNGILYTSATNYLTVTNASATVSIGSNSSYVNGPFKYTMALNGSATLNMPIGKDGDYRPVKIMPTHNNTNPYTYTAELFNGDANALSCSPKPTGIANLSAVHYWRINRSDDADGLSTAQVELFYDNNDGVLDYAQLKVIKSSGNDCPSVWTNIGGTASGNNSGSIVSGSFNSFSVFTLGNTEGGGNPLPIQLNGFSVQCKEGNHLLQWSTLSEVNNKQFEIEQSTDARNWNLIATVAGAGTTLVPKHYSYTVNGSNYSYYRLKQVDYDERLSFSPIVHASSCMNTATVNVVPNPVTGPLQLLYSGFEANDIKQIIIKDILGQTIQLFTHQTTHNIDLSNIQSGMYWVQIILNDGSMYNTNFMKQ